MSERKRAHILVSGHVQGVFFRDNTQRWAAGLNLAGWVRNLPDGRVEAVAAAVTSQMIFSVAARFMLPMPFAPKATT